MARHRELSKPHEHITKEILLLLLQSGASLAIEVIDTFHIKFRHPLSHMGPDWEVYYPSSVNRQLTRLWRHGYAQVTESRGGYAVTLSDRGKTEILRYDVHDLEVPTQTHWDGMWRMVIFDIPSGEEHVRAAFRDHLKSIGFYQMQKSVYVYPYPCDKQIQFLREVYGIPHFVKIATICSLENDEDLRKIFKL